MQVTVEGAKERIRANLPIEEVISRYTTLKARGRKHWGLCPFHAEKTPSFAVDIDKGLWYCHGSCHKGGDVFSFIQRVEGIEFLDALEKLANELGLEVERKSQKDPSLWALTAEVQAGFTLDLQNTPHARDYVAQRGLELSADIFGVGYARPNMTSLLRGKPLDRIGIVKKGYEFFRGRLTFPVFDWMDRVAGWQGRALEDVQPKYLTLSDTELFRKSEQLFGLMQAKPLIRHFGYALVTEGPIDTMHVYQAGFPAVAGLGSSVSDQQFALLRRAGAETVYAAFDNPNRDKAGLKAALATIEALRGYVGVRIVVWPKQYQDPGEMDAEAIQQAVARAMTPAQFLIKLSAAYNDVDQRLEYLRKYMTPTNERDTLPQELEMALAHEGLMLHAKKAVAQPAQSANAKAEVLRLLEADIAAVLYSVRGQDRVDLAQRVELDVLPEPGGLLAPMLEALTQPDPMLALTRLSAGDLFARRVMAAPAMSRQEAEERLTALCYRFNLAFTERRLAEIRAQIRQDGETPELLQHLQDWMDAQEGFRRTRFSSILISG